MDTANSIGFLLEYCAKRCLKPPTYVEEDPVGPDHCRNFTCSCYFLEHNVKGKGCTKKQAKQEAATAMVKILNDNKFFENTPLPETTSNGTGGNIRKNAISVLQEFCQQKGLPLPSYLDNAAPSAGFLCECIVEGKNTVGKGMTKKAAKHVSAVKMLQEFNFDIENLIGAVELPCEESVDVIAKNPISALIELCSKNQLPGPVFEVEPTVASVFTMKVSVGEYVAKGVASNKQGAKTNAASKLLVVLHAQGYTESVVKVNKMWSANSPCENVEAITANLDDILPDLSSDEENTVSTSVAALSLDDSVVEVEPSSNRVGYEWKNVSSFKRVDYYTFNLPPYFF